MQRAIEAAGIPTIIIAALPPVVRQTGTPRAVAPRVPMGANAGEPHNVEMQTGIVKATLEQLVKLDTPGKVVPLPFEYVAKYNQIGKRDIPGRIGAKALICRRCPFYLTGYFDKISC